MSLKSAEYVVLSIDDEEIESEIVGHEAAHRNNAEIIDFCHKVFGGDKKTKELLTSIEDSCDEYNTTLATSSQHLPENAPPLQLHASIYTKTPLPKIRALALRNIIGLLAQSVSIHIFVTTAQWLCRCNDTPVLLNIIMAMYAAYMEDTWLLEGDSAEYWKLYGSPEFKALLLPARQEIEMRKLRADRLEVGDIFGGPWDGASRGEVISWLG